MCVLDFQKNKLTIRIAYDYKDNRFYFSFILNDKQQLFLDFFEKKEIDFNWKSFMPDDFQYKESLERNVEYLKKYKKDILAMTK
jgi:hypothetical protein